MFHQNNPERHTVAGIAGPTQIKSKTMLRKNVSQEDSQSKSSKGSKAIIKKSINPHKKMPTSGRKQTLSNQGVTVDSSPEKGEVVPLQQ